MMNDDDRPLTGLQAPIQEPIQQKAPVNIDDMVIPASKAKVISFEELLEQKLDQLNEEPVGQTMAPLNQKKEFLKRKS